MRLYLLIAFILLANPAFSYFINIDANEETCFFERATSGTRMGLMFEVAEGGFLDIDVKVRLAK
jgi:hypothetical protein